MRLYDFRRYERPVLSQSLITWSIGDGSKANGNEVGRESVEPSIRGMPEKLAKKTYLGRPGACKNLHTISLVNTCKYEATEQIDRND